jgi:hypothetical protein
MGLPPLFGSDYILPAILVVFILLCVLGLAVLRGRQKKRSAGELPAGKPGRLSKAEKLALKTKAKPARSTREGRKATALAAMHERDATEAAEMSAESVAGEATGIVGEGAGFVGATAEVGGLPVTSGEGAAEAAAEARPGVPPPPPDAGRGGLSGSRRDRQKPVREVRSDTNLDAALESDPLQRVLASILLGWGDLTTEDTKRLDVFRHDKVVAAITKVEVPKEGKGTEYAKTRLTQLRRYAGSLEQSARSAPPVPEVHEFAGLPLSPSPAAASVGAAGAASSQATRAAGVAAGAAAAGTAAMAAEAVTPAAAAPGRRSWYATEPENEPGAPQEPEVMVVRKAPEPREWRTTPTGERTAESEMELPAAEERAAEFNWGNDDELGATQSQFKAVDLTWNHEPAGVTTPPAQPAAAAPVAAPQAVAQPPAAAPAESWGNGDEASRSAEAAVAAAAAAFWGTPDAPRHEQSVGVFGKNVSSAADVMALPVDERADMLAFLEPGELTKVYQTAGDKDLKKAVIDTLEHVGNTASLDAIHSCLEDEDPEIQLYALDAAERMLGKGS